MDQCTHEVRKQYWMNIISQCQQRPQGQSAKQWMKENGICVQTYYRWQRTIRKELFACASSMTNDSVQVPGIEKDTEISFVELPAPVGQDIHRCGKNVPGEIISTATAVIRTDACVIEIANGISGDLLSAILREVSHA